MKQEHALPPFEIAATTHGFLTDAEMDQLIAEHQPALSEGKLGIDDTNAEVRRSRIAFLGNVPRYEWLYQRIWEVAVECNQRFFCADLLGIEANIQLARYDSADQGFYDWHMDFGRLAPLRKLSVSIQLSRPEDYEGGDLELLFDRQPYALEKTRGAFIAFPSFAVHRVTPVTRGERWSLVAWLTGTRWR